MLDKARITRAAASIGNTDYTHASINRRSTDHYTLDISTKRVPFTLVMYVIARTSACWANGKARIVPCWS